MMSKANGSSGLRLAGDRGVPLALDEQMPNFERRITDMPAALFRHIPTGIPWMDDAFGGGIVPQDLVWVFGKQSVGKTTLLLQWARATAIWATENNYPIAPFFVCYEHDEWDLFTRLLCLESYYCDPSSPLKHWEVRQAIREVKDRQNDGEGGLVASFFDELGNSLPDVALEAWQAIGSYAARLFLYYGSRVYTTVQSIGEIIEDYRVSRELFLIPFVDYLQTVPAPTELTHLAFSETELVYYANIGALKDLAVVQNVPVVVTAAVDSSALKEQRPVHIEDVLGPEQSQYSPDRALAINPDIFFGESGGDTKRNDVIRLSLEKNRNGPSELEYRHKRIGASFIIEPEGQAVELSESYQQDRVKTQKPEAVKG